MSASSRPIATTARSSNAPAPTSAARTSWSRSYPSSSGSSGGARADPAEAEDPDILDASTWGPVLVVRTLFNQLGLWTILDAALGKAKGVPFADRAFVLVAHRVTPPAT